MKTLISNFQKSIFGFLKILILSKFNGSLKIKDSEKECIILANGPSLKISLEKYFDRIKNSTLICMNHFCSAEQYTQLKPKYYILQDPLIFKEENELTEDYLHLQRKLTIDLFTKTEWNLILMLPHNSKKSNFHKKIIQNKNIKIIYFNNTGIEGFNWFSHLMFNLKLAMPRPENVLIPTVMNCIHIGFETIKIVGADHNWFTELSVSHENITMLNQKHFYHELQNKAKPVNDKLDGPRKIHEIIFSIYLALKGYWEIEQYAKLKNTTIYNCSEVSMIDAFRRKKLDY